MKKENYARKGFTLVELLIVIVVIGILSAMMMLSSTEAMSSAKASNIVSNLRNLKTATLAWYADHTDYVTEEGKVKFGTGNADLVQKFLTSTATDTTANKVNILKYFNNEGSITFGTTLSDGGYTLQADNSGNWYVGYQFASNESSVKEKLLGRAKSIGLGLGGTTPTTNIPTSVTNDTKVVWMKVLGVTNN